MGNHQASKPTEPDIAGMLSALEAQLAQLDRIGACIAAAHLDAAIHALRLDQAARVQKTEPH